MSPHMTMIKSECHGMQKVCKNIQEYLGWKSQVIRSHQFSHFIFTQEAQETATQTNSTKSKQQQQRNTAQCKMTIKHQCATWVWCSTSAITLSELKAPERNYAGIKGPELRAQRYRTQMYRDQLPRTTGPKAKSPRAQPYRGLKVKMPGLKNTQLKSKQHKNEKSSKTQS